MLDIGVDGAADDRTRPHDRHLHDQIFQAAGLGAQQGLDLGPALDLEGADRVPGADHVVDRRIGEIDPAEIDRRLAVGGDQVQRLLDQREHPQREEIDLDEPGIVAGILVPLAEKRPSMAAGWTGTSSTRGAEEMIIPPECWVTWRGNPASCSGQLDQIAPGRRVLALRVRRDTRQLQAESPAGRGSLSLAIWSRSASGMPSALPTSRTAERSR